MYDGLNIYILIEKGNYRVGRKTFPRPIPPNNTLFHANNVELEHLMFPQGVVHFQHASYFHIEKVL
jgi:hypothetical protein